MATRLYWVDGPWPGKLALAARPRGGDWLGEEMMAWRRAGVDTILSLLTPDEARDFDLGEERAAARTASMELISFPIPDRQVPESEAEAASVFDRINAMLSSGRNTVIHCRQGVGRSGLVAAGLLVMRGTDPKTAVERLSAARGVTIPETLEQRRWIDRYAATLAGAK